MRQTNNKHLKSIELTKTTTSSLPKSDALVNSDALVKPLTPKEKNVLNFITDYFLEKGYSPTYQEIKDNFGLASFNSVQNYLKQLQAKKYLQLFPNQKRCIEILKTSEFFQEKLLLSSKKAESNSSPNKLLHNGLNDSNSTLSSPLFDLPFLGRVAAGNPIERVLDNETFTVPPYLVKSPDSTFVLQVEGNSMIEEGINHKDFILVQEQSHAKNGDIIVATVNTESIMNESTVKRVYFHNPTSKVFKEQSLLKPDLSGTSMIVELRPSNKELTSIFHSIKNIVVKGIVIGLIRKF